MNISPTGMIVRFKTVSEERFIAEKSGAKPNTVQILDVFEADRIHRAPPTKISIRFNEDVFLRTLTNICRAGEVLGKAIVIFSWTNEKHHHPLPDKREHDRLAHTMSLDDDYHIHTVGQDEDNPPTTEEAAFTPVPISSNLHGLLQSIAHGRSMNMVIRELYEASQYQQFEADGDQSHD